jgi:hypothetical protein
MKRQIALMLTLAAGLTLAVTPALAGKGGGGGGMNTATISFAGSSASATTLHKAGDLVGFAVNANVKDSDLYKLWVANRCSQNGTLVYAQDAPVYNGYAGEFTLAVPNGGAADCTAYVWLFPNSGSPLRGGSMTYSISAAA